MKGRKEGKIAVFLTLRPIDWSTPAYILEKIIKYEAVHEIAGWEELRRRLAPADRRCFAVFHPRLANRPGILAGIGCIRPAACGLVILVDCHPSG